MSVADLFEYLNIMYQKVDIAVGLEQGDAHTGQESACNEMRDARTGMRGARTGSQQVWVG